MKTYFVPIFLALLVVGGWLGLVSFFPVGITVQQAELFGKWGVSEMGLRLSGTVGLLVLCLAFSYWLKSGWAGLILACNPWVWWLALDYPTVLSLVALVVGVLAVQRVKIKVIFLIGLMLVLVWHWPVWLKMSEDSLRTRLNSVVLTTTINEVQKTNFLATDKKYMLPSLIRKILYNKLFLATDILAKRTVGLVDFSLWTAPLSAWAITGMDGVPPKGVLPLFYYWELPLLLVGFGLVIKDNKQLLLLMCLFGLPALFLEKKVFFISGVMLLPILIELIFNGCKYFRKFILVIGTLYFLGVVTLSWQIFARPMSNLTADRILYRSVAEWIKVNQKNRQIVVTTKFGPMETMLKYYGIVVDEKIQVRDFDIKTERNNVPTIYIGLPKQLQGLSGADIIYEIPADDELVYGYGKGIWIGIKN